MGSSVENTTDAKDHNNDLKDKSFISRSTQTLNTESHENTTQTAKESDVKLQLEAKTPEKLDTVKNNTDSTVSLPALNSNAPENNMLNSKTYRSTGDALMKDGATNCDSTKVRSSSSSSSHKSRSRRRRGRSKDKEEDETKQKSNEGSLNLLESAVTSNGPSKL
ncbi:hypothetical protein LSTR_LSTR015489 [Laodelphax striatellus]|uniref:Uncharacterized protein n=1 Tax=Laodelphax striatellus TaxID=195883 RepID=A0A482XKE6_LAOST|nr:hypothetical protein LSTR_LSTR015489 [Laodelphax striatellus]